LGPTDEATETEEGASVMLGATDEAAEAEATVVELVMMMRVMSPHTMTLEPR
jgi:hypothetical protein